MDPVTIARGMWLAVGLVLLGVLFLKYLATVHALFRYRIFVVRRELLLMVADGEIDASHPAYRSLRDLMNGLLRYTENITFMRCMVSAILCKDEASAMKSNLTGSIDSVEDAATREKLRNIYQQVTTHLLKLVLITSPVLLWSAVGLLVILLAAILLLRGERLARIGVEALVLRVLRRLPTGGVEVEATKQLAWYTARPSMSYPPSC
jgi:hypothetical protein